MAIKGQGSPGVRLSRAECEQIHKHLDLAGEDATAQALRVNRVTIYRALAGRGIRRSTAECVRARLRALSSAATGTA